MLDDVVSHLENTTERVEMLEVSEMYRYLQGYPWNLFICPIPIP